MGISKENYEDEFFGGQNNGQIYFLVGTPGGNAAVVLKTIRTERYVGAGEMTIREAYGAFKSGSLKKFENS